MRTVIFLRLLILAAGCGPGLPSVPVPDPVSEPVSEPVVDDPPSVPALRADLIELRMPETVIPAHTEQMTCAFLEPTTEELFVRQLVSYQGKLGHHFVLFKTVSRVEPGTVRPCNTGLDMGNMIPVLSSVDFGLAELPDGLAVRVAKGTQLVLQQHVVNTSASDIATHDVMHVTRVDPAKVSTTVGFYGLSDVTFKIPARAEVSLVFECKAPRDMNLLLMGPHMHEWGSSFQSWAGAAASPTKVIDIPRWSAEMREAPPVKQFPLDAPLRLSEGDIVRTRCTYQNTSIHPIEFPTEMCATSGYYFPATDGEEWVCGAVSRPD